MQCVRTGKPLHSRVICSARECLNHIEMQNWSKISPSLLHSEFTRHAAHIGGGMGRAPAPP
jgi:hypothetical protein